jgi:predicted Zn-dependent protease
MILCPNLLSTSIITIFVLTALVLLLPYSSSYYFPNQYATAAHSSSTLKKSKGDSTIQICCSWGEQIADGILTYRIIDDSNSKVVKAVHQAIDEWNSKVSNIQLQEATDSNTPADIDIKTNSKAPQLAHSAIRTTDGHTISDRKNIKLVQPGEASVSYDASGLITHVDMTISTKALGNSIDSSELESIAKHEIGHAYGLGHTDFGSDLMSPILTGSGNTDISQCDINAVEEANQWKLKGDSNTSNNSPHAPSLQFLRC